MMEPEDIWTNISLPPIEMEELDNINRSNFELHRFSKILIWECIVGIIITFLLVFYRDNLPDSVLMIAISTAIFGIMFSLHGIYSIRQIDIANSPKDFLQKSITFLKTFSWRLFILTFILLIAAGIFLFYFPEDLNKLQISLWFYILLSTIILSILGFYIRVVYYQKIKNLEGILEDIKKNVSS